MTIRNEKNRPGVAIIVAVDEQNGIGRKGGLLCHLPADLKHFKEITTGHAIIMGRKTYESLPKGAFASSNDDEFVFIIGGERVYRASLPLADMLYMTRVHHTFNEVDTFFPEIDSDKWVLVEEERHERDEKHPYSFSFQTYIKKSNEI